MDIEKKRRDVTNVLKRYLGVKAEWKVTRHKGKMIARRMLLDEQYFDSATMTEADHSMMGDRLIWATQVQVAVDRSEQLPPEQKARFDALYAEVIDEDWATLNPHTRILTFVRDERERLRREAFEVARAEREEREAREAAAAAAAEAADREGKQVNF